MKRLRGDDEEEAALSWFMQQSRAGHFNISVKGEILRCPWHDFSYDVRTGACLTAHDRLRVKTYPLVIEHSEVFLEI